MLCEKVSYTYKSKQIGVGHLFAGNHIIFLFFILLLASSVKAQVHTDSTSTQKIVVLDSVSVIAVQRPWDVRSQMQTVGTTIYAGKKNELVDLNTLVANTAACAPHAAEQRYLEKGADANGPVAGLLWKCRPTTQNIPQNSGGGEKELHFFGRYSGG